MKFLKLAAAPAVFLLFGTLVPVHAQRDGDRDRQGDKQGDKQGDRRDNKQEKRAPQAKTEQQRQTPQQVQRPAPVPQQPQAQQPQRQRQPQAQQQQQPRQQQSHQQQSHQQTRQQVQPSRTRQQAQSWQQQRGWLKPGGWQGRDTWQQDRAQHWASDHRSWAQRGGYGGYYVPQNTFSLYFGSRHFFRLTARPVIYQGYPRFTYGGYSFLMLDPWPETWSEDWYASDDVYIDYDDGYYLYNRRDPQVRLAITVTL